MSDPHGPTYWVLETALATYHGRDGFERDYRETADRGSNGFNLAGPRAEACDCAEVRA